MTVPSRRTTASTDGSHRRRTASRDAAPTVTALPAEIAAFASVGYASPSAALDGALEALSALVADDALVAIVPSGRRQPEVRLTANMAFPDTSRLRELVVASKDGPCVVDIDGRLFVTYAGAGPDALVLVGGTGTHARSVIERWAAILVMPIIASSAIAREHRTETQMQRLDATTSRIAASLRLDDVLAEIVRDAVELLGASSGDMLLLDDERDVLRVVAVANLLPEMLGFEMRTDEGVSSRAMTSRRTVIVDDYERYRHRVRRLDRYRFRSVLCAPLIVRGSPIGALNVHATDTARRFDESDASLLSSFATHAAIAIDNARRFGNEARLAGDLARANAELERSLTLQRRLSEQVLIGAGPSGVAEELARLLDRPVVLQDDVLRVVAGAAPRGEDWEGLSLVRDTRGAVDAAIAEVVESGRPSTIGEDDVRLVAPVRIGAETVGFVVLPETATLSALDRALVDVAVTGVALEFAKLRAEVEAERRVRGDVLTDLVTGSFTSAASVAARAAPAGLDLSIAHDVFVIDVSPESDRGHMGGRRQVLELAQASVASWSSSSAVGDVAGDVVVLASCQDMARGGSVERDPAEVARDLHAILTEHVPAIQLSIGIGERCDDPTAYAASYRVAKDAVDIAGKLGRTGGVIDGRCLGLARVIASAANAEELQTFARRTLGGLLEHRDLLETLEAYVDAGFNQREAARRSFVHFNTIAYRLRRVEQILGVSLNDPSALLDVTLALRIAALARDP
jgi:sugar diacid utilization regulator/GAF domain-containing protein